LAQIGEFSFILSDLGRHHGLMTERGHNFLVACALVSITLNPILFRFLTPIENALKRRPKLWNLLNTKAQRRQNQINQEAGAEIEELSQAGADNAVYEEAEAAIGLARLVLLDQGADRDTVRAETTRIREQFHADGPARS